MADEGWDILLPYPILLEAYSLVLSRLGGPAALAWLDESSAASFINPGRDDYAQAFAIVPTLVDQEISLVDATLAALSMRLKLQVWTYDHHFDVMRIQCGADWSQTMPGFASGRGRYGARAGYHPES